MTGEEKKAARMAMGKLDKARAILSGAASLASKAGTYQSQETIYESMGKVSQAMAEIDNAIRLPSKGSAQARTLSLFK